MCFQLAWLQAPSATPKSEEFVIFLQTLLIWTQNSNNQSPCQTHPVNEGLKSGLIESSSLICFVLHQSLKTSTIAIDIVYLWVNGNDSQWRAKRQKYAQQLLASGNLSFAKFGDVEGRYRDNDELRFSLRALDKFFPEHGHVYIVTDGQVPDWFEASDQITLIDHHQLIPDSALPVFDSGNIESYIHHIPGLSERYFYLNDDVFFGAPVCLENWFFRNGFYVSWSDEPEVLGDTLQAESTSLENASRLSKQWLQQKAADANVGANSVARKMDLKYQHTPRTFSHSPRPMLKSMMLEIERDAPELFERVRSTVFRTWDKPTIISDFVLRWALAHGFAKTMDHSHLYIATGQSFETQSFKHLKKLFGRLDFFCINDTTDDAKDGDPRLVQMHRILSALLPDASHSELANCDARAA
jgi:hypothetical protein